MTKFKTTDEDGKEIEVEAFTQDEVNAQMEESKTAFEAKIEEGNAAMAEMQKTTADLEAQLGDTQEDHKNFKTLKEALKESKAGMDTLKEEMEAGKTKRKEEAMDATIRPSSFFFAKQAGFAVPEI